MGNNQSSPGDLNKVDTTRLTELKDTKNDYAGSRGRTVKRNILLVGTSGRGKSATGNSILGCQMFEISDSAATNPDSIVCASKEVDGLKLTVCDALTIQDIRMTQNEAQTDIKERLEKCFDACPDGFHFIIFVFSYIDRVTSEESDAAETLTKLFGGRLFTDQGISVFTHGENFDLQRKKSKGPDFDTWYRNTQDPLLQKICNNMKAFMMYNVHLEKMTGQRQEILNIIRNCRMCVRRGQHGYILVDTNDASESNYSEDARQHQSNALNPGRVIENYDRKTNLLGQHMDIEKKNRHVQDSSQAYYKAGRAHQEQLTHEPTDARYTDIQQTRLHTENKAIRQNRGQHRYSAVDMQRTHYSDARRQRSACSVPQPRRVEGRIYKDGAMPKIAWSEAPGPILDHRGKPSTKTKWNMILVYNSDHRGKTTRNALLGPKKNRLTQTRKKLKIGLRTVSTETNFKDELFKVMDGKNLLSTKKIEDKRLLLKDSFEHFPHGFHALVLVLSKKEKLAKKEVKAVQDLKNILGEDFLRDHCILLYPYGKKLSHGGLSREAWCEQQKGQLKDLITECNRRVVPFYKSIPEKKEESINDLILFMQQIQKPFTGSVFPKKTFDGNKCSRSAQLPGSKGFRPQTTDDHFPIAPRMGESKYQHRVFTQL